MGRLNTLRAVLHTAAGASLLLLLGTAAAAPAPQSMQRLVVAIQPTLNLAGMLETVKPFKTYLEERLPGVGVEIFVPLSQAGVIEALRFGKAYVAFVGPWAAQLAAGPAGVRISFQGRA